jgi:hypothetical protein
MKMHFLKRKLKMHSSKRELSADSGQLLLITLSFVGCRPTQPLKVGGFTEN